MARPAGVAQPPAFSPTPPDPALLQGADPDSQASTPAADGGLPTGEAPQTASEALRLSATATRPDATRPLAHQVAQQIAQATSRAAQAPTELHLDPEELGRLTLRLSTDETAVTLHLTAERAETSDLLRRHIALLEDSYRALGYERIEIMLNGRHAGGGAGQGGGQGTSLGPDASLLSEAPPEGTTPEARGPEPAAPRPGTDRVDLRL
ncbi:flagellar hook-length control protein FliK [Pseudooceanicola sp. 200-1SW]|uniref:flagellar hook-length control protein FliK n=1 Tax=Pseudooceanicola sp. 200-1SW TaxID=3425949 RepID=UPI003D7F528A